MCVFALVDVSAPLHLLTFSPHCYDASGGNPHPPHPPIPFFCANLTDCGLFIRLASNQKKPVLLRWELHLKSFRLGQDNE